MSIFAIAAGIPDDIGAGYPLGPFFSSIAELVPARSRAARTRRSARRYALPQRPDEGKHLSQTSHYVGRPRPPQGRWGPTIFFGGSSARSEEHTSELQSLMRISYAVFCLNKKNIHTQAAGEHEADRATKEEHRTDTQTLTSLSTAG